MWNIEKLISKGDYYYAKVIGHPNLDKSGYILCHRVVMENHLGRLLEKSEIVHHKNGDKKDNRIENLELMNDSDHRSYHGELQGRSDILLKCPSCETLFVRRKGQTFLQKGGTFTCCSRKCRGVFSKMIQVSGRIPDIARRISENIVEHCY